MKKSSFEHHQSQFGVDERTIPTILDASIFHWRFLKQLVLLLIFLAAIVLAGCASKSSYYVSPKSSEHVVEYVRALNNVFSKLYRSTMEYSEIQEQYPDFSENTLTMTTSIQVSKDLTDASSFLEPFIKDKDQSIQVSSNMLYLDIFSMLKANNVVADLYRNISPDNIDTLQYSIANLVGAQKTLKNDLLDNILMVITKWIIQIPVEDSERVWPVKYAISKEQRQSLLEDIDHIFGNNMKNAEDNIYLMSEKIIQLSLVPDTYEEQASLSLSSNPKPALPAAE